MNPERQARNDRMLDAMLSVALMLIIIAQSALGCFFIIQNDRLKTENAELTARVTSLKAQNSKLAWIHWREMPIEDTSMPTNEIRSRIRVGDMDHPLAFFYQMDGMINFRLQEKR